jgi:hydroxyethylthiazole kinase-like uncharacterized protein yjeF
MTREHIRKIPARREDSHKGDYGRVFVVAGSPGLTGAAFLCCEGALRSGSGLVTNGIPESLNPVMEVKLTECMTLPLTETQHQTLGLAARQEILDFAKKCDVVALGPGLGRDSETKPLVKRLVQEIESPIVLDADGIIALEGDIDVLKDRNRRLVLTPHPGEMASLTGKEVAEVQSMREDIAKSVAEVTGAVVCLKGHRTVVAGPEGEVYVNETGNSGMATGGMGDILTGMIASFMGQGIDDYSAAVIAVYLHGAAGDIAAEKKGPFNMIATDVLEYLPEAFSKAGI